MTMGLKFAYAYAEFSEFNKIKNAKEISGKISGPVGTYSSVFLK